MNPGIPESVKLEHEELHTELAHATKAGGKTGEAAKAVAKVLHDHFFKEEEFAFPPPQAPIDAPEAFPATPL